MKKIFSVILKTLAVSIVMFVVWLVASIIISRALDIDPPPEMIGAMPRIVGALFVVSLIHTAVLVYTLLRSHWYGGKLLLTIFGVYFGINAFMSQIETLYFNQSLEISTIEIWSYVIASLVQAGIFAPLAVWLFGKWKPSDAVTPPFVMPQKELAWKLAFLTVIFYPVLYFLFGYYVLWQLPEARMLYSGSEAILPFGKHMLTNVFQHDPWLYPWQILRGSCWVLLAWPVMRMSKERWWETGFMVGLLFAMLMNAQHLIPNPYMGTAVQWRHFMETATSNFILGFVVVWLLHGKDGI